ncbi:helix-turn-helix domain-containing protein, partial [Raoultella planticola]|uniref:helix-turn-helix domain-containing protein n=1 Tax=Raoultella planticola TaxID=575 RepID=UPI0013D2638A
VEARIARWLLEIHDRMDGNAIPLTQEAVSQLVGVRRTTVTLVMLNLRKIGAINHEQRGLIEINRPILEGVACDCYEVMRQKADRVTPQQAIG